MIRVGVGGWTFAPWRASFYPEGLPAKRELEYASRHLTSIEINGTFYRSQGPKSFAKWREETPEDFVFTVKGHRAVVNAKALGGTGEALEWFFKSGVTELGQKLGPILWQLAPFKKFDRDDLAAFFALLPKEHSGIPIRNVLEVRHASFVVPEFVDLARANNVAIVYADSDEHPAIADVTADFVYARLQRSIAKEPTGYASKDLDRWTKRAKLWAAGSAPDDLTYLADGKVKKSKRDVFLFFISGAKERNPQAAQALIERLKD
jgi:uncharacterized protein YecE (DUF72 family)